MDINVSDLTILFLQLAIGIPLIIVALHIDKEYYTPSKKGYRNRAEMEKALAAKEEEYHIIEDKLKALTNEEGNKGGGLK